MIYAVSLSQSYECTALPIQGDDNMFEGLRKLNVSRQVFCIAIIFKPSFKVYFTTIFDMMLAPMHNINVQLEKILFYNFDISHNLECSRGRALETEDVILHTAGPNQNVYVPNTGFYGLVNHVPLMLSYSVKKDEIMQPDTQYNSTVLICVDDQDPVSVESLIGLTFMETITIIGNAISVFALLLTFFSLCFFSSLNGTFRILLINLTISLFIAQTTFMFQDIFISYQILCLCIAIFHHYAWLSYFFLMNAIAFEVALKFRSFNSLIKGRCNLVHKEKLACLLVYGWVTPLFLVITGVVLDNVESSQFSPQYGKGSACWMNNPMGVLAFFVIPFSCIVCLNTCLLVFAIIRIKRISTHGAVLSQEQSYFHTNVKLSVLMGVSWMIGLVASYTEIDAIWYVFIVLNTLQGAVLFFTFGLSTRNQSCNMSKLISWTNMTNN